MLNPATVQLAIALGLLAGCASAFVLASIVGAVALAGRYRAPRRRYHRLKRR